MKNINIRKHYYHIRHRFFTMNNVVVAVALVIGASWAWGSINMMQRNYGLQKEVDSKQRQQKLAELEVATLEYERNYYKSNEYKELAVREHLGMADPGEKVLILPPNSKAAKSTDKKLKKAPKATALPPGNVEQWMNFLFGGNREGLHK